MSKLAGMRLSGKMSITDSNSKCRELQMLSLNQFADNTCNSVASTQVYLPKILNVPVFHADKGAVVKETLVAMSMFLSCRHRVYLSNSFQTHSNRGPSNTCGSYEPKLSALETWRNQRRMAIQAGSSAECTQTLTY